MHTAVRICKQVPHLKKENRSGTIRSSLAEQGWIFAQTLLGQKGSATNCTHNININNCIYLYRKFTLVFKFLHFHITLNYQYRHQKLLHVE